MLTIKNIKKSYKRLSVLNIQELDIPKGQSLGIIGNNGAGKTTLFRVILDLIRPDSGTIYIQNNDVSTTEDWKEFTGSFIDERFLIDYLTPEEYFNFLKHVYGLSTSDLDDYLSSFQTLFNDEVFGYKKYIRDLSKGNKKKVGIAGALIANPTIVLLDEPFENLDPTSQIRLKQIITQFKTDKNVTFLISSHDLNHITEICDRIVLLEKGEVHSDLQVTPDTLEQLNHYFRENT